jgi:hypothetical protein
MCGCHNHHQHTHTGGMFPQEGEPNAIDYTHLIPDLPQSWINYYGAAPCLDTEEGYDSDGGHDGYGGYTSGIPEAGSQVPKKSRCQKRQQRSDKSAREELARMQAFLAPSPVDCNPAPVMHATTAGPSTAPSPYSAFTLKEWKAMPEERFLNRHWLIAIENQPGFDDIAEPAPAPTPRGSHHKHRQYRSLYHIMLLLLFCLTTNLVDASPLADHDMWQQWAHPVFFFSFLKRGPFTTFPELYHFQSFVLRLTRGVRGATPPEKNILQLFCTSY